jgi:hypothetical protein
MVDQVEREEEEEDICSHTQVNMVVRVIMGEAEDGATGAGGGHPIGYIRQKTKY